MPNVDQAIKPRELAPEGRSLLDRQARRYLDMSGEKVARAWDAGEFADHDDGALARVAMLLPSGR